ncbi:MAG: glycosyltransferase family 2 protein [Candidatus Gottesmanbacteria bacterium]|nr:glycosyltransferase family 2 protein [Candidatus Gottesmanbacteria bacterium]
MAKKKITSSVAIAVYNEEVKLDACLSSVVAWADEIVLVDGGSRDRTLEIAKRYNARIIHSDNPPIFHINKQKALVACRSEWILQLDADEVVTPELREEILNLMRLLTFPPATLDAKHLRAGDFRLLTPNGYYIPRKNFFCGHWMRKGGQYPDYVIRLVRRGKANFPCKSVHEQISVDGQIGYIINPLLHHSYSSIAEYWYKANSYIALQAQEMKHQKLSVNLVTWFVYNAVKPSVTFILLYVRHKGFLDGYWGLLFALFSALHHPLAYWRYSRNHEEIV